MIQTRSSSVQLKNAINAYFSPHLQKNTQNLRVICLSIAILGLLKEFSVEPIIFCLDTHNQLGLSGVSTRVLWMSVHLFRMMQPCSHSHSPAVLSAFVPFSAQSPNSTLKSVFFLLASYHKEAFVEMIQQEIIQISCTQLGLHALAVYVLQRE